MKKIDKNKKSLIKIAGATMVAIFSLASMFAGTYAWFTLQSGVDVTGSQFKVIVTSGTVKSITVHEYIGENYDGVNELGSSFCFNPKGVTAYPTPTPPATPATVSLHPYSADIKKKNHPVMILFGVDGGYSSIKFKTDYCYLGDSNIYCVISGSYQSLNSLTGDNTIRIPGNDGKYYKVITGESSYDVYRYKHGSGSFILMSGFKEITYTYGTHSEIVSDLNNLIDGKYYKVTADSECDGVSVVYQYDSSNNSLKMVFVDLDNDKNPLSSVTQFHSVRFKIKDVSVESTTYETYSELKNNVNSLINGRFYKITSDENIGGGENIYQYNSSGADADNKLKMAWQYLDSNGVVYDMVSNERVQAESTTTPYTYTDKTNQSVISLRKTILEDEGSAFCNINSQSVSFSNETSIFNGALDGADYVGVVVDYNPDSIEYICSAFLGHANLESDLGFKCDWTTII